MLNLKLINQKFTVTCDGAAATGKSTGAKLIAKKYKLPFLSSGLLYRYAGYLKLKYKPKNYTNFIRKKFSNLNYKKLSKINLHTPEISSESSNIAKILKVRNILKKYQKNFINKSEGCVLEGRDASTKILPNSDVKFFFICNINTAAKRRYNELKKKSKKINLNQIKKALNKRNQSDKTRSISPLQKHPDAIVVNTTKSGKKAMLAIMSKHIEKILKRKYEDRARSKRIK